MLLGFMRNKEKPMRLAKLTAMLAKFKGIDLLYFNADGVDMGAEKIKGKMLVKDDWVDVESRIPKVIDISAFCHKHRDVVRFLNTQSYLTDDGKKRLSKERLQEYLLQDDNFAHYVIPTQPLLNYDNLVDYIDEHGKVVIKPVYSQKGRGVYIITKCQDEYLVGHNKNETRMVDKEFKSLYEEVFKSRRHIVQKYIQSKTENGDPFDFRVHLEKNRKGDWVVVRIIPRIGINQKVIANVNQGGGRAVLVPFLKANFEEDWKSIRSKLRKLGLSLALKVEEIRNTELMTLGIDVGMDENQNLYVFEANSAPAVSVIESDVALNRVDYYEYIFENNVE